MMRPAPRPGAPAFAPCACARGAAQRSDGELALALARAASHICVSAPRRARLTKADGTPASAADLAIQSMVSDALSRLRPADALVGEEEEEGVCDAARRAGPLWDEVRALAAAGAATLHAEMAGGGAASGRGILHRPPACWTLDPIDGTKGYIAGAAYAVGIALLPAPALLAAGGPPPVAALALPARGVVLQCDVAGRVLRVRPARSADEGGVWEGGERQGQGQGQGKDGVVAATLHQIWHASGSGSDALQPRGWGAPSLLCCGSLVKYAAVARGEAAAFVQVVRRGGGRERVWDHAAGVAAVVAAGGQVTDECGNAISVGVGPRRAALAVQGRAIVASARDARHDAVCVAVRHALRALP